MDDPAPANDCRAIADKAAGAPSLLPPAPRGVYLRRHHARVIERGNLLVVEFLDHERAAERPRYPGVRLPAWQVALMWGASLSARTLEMLRSR